MNNTIYPFVEAEIPDYIKKYPSISRAVADVKDLVDQWHAPSENINYELEAKFGVYAEQHFESGVSEQFVEKLYNLINGSPVWKSITPWVESHDFFYKIKDGRTIRSSCDLISNSNKSIYKTKIDSVILKHQILTSAAASPYNYDLRISLSAEELIPRTILPNIVEPLYVRIKSRKSYYYKSGNFPSEMPIWRLDITRVWDGQSKHEAETKQRMGETPKYEVEYECISPQAVLNITDAHDSWYLACSLLLKCEDLLCNINSIDNNNYSFEYITVPTSSSTKRRTIPAPKAFLENN